MLLSADKSCVLQHFNNISVEEMFIKGIVLYKCFSQLISITDSYLILKDHTDKITDRRQKFKI